MPGSSNVSSIRGNDTITMEHQCNRAHLHLDLNDPEHEYKGFIYYTVINEVIVT